MSADMPLLTRQTITAAKLETTTGTAIALAAADATTNAMDSEINYDSEFSDRRGQSALSRLAGVAGLTKGKLKFKSELYGKGGAGVPLWASTFLAASGMLLSTATYAPQTGSSSQATLTAAVYQDGRFKSLAGVSMNWTLNLEAGKPGIFEWEGDGVYVAPSGVALITPTYDTVIPPVFQGATITVGGTTYKVNKVTISPNNEISMRQSAASAFGYFSSVIVDRRFTIKIDPESLALATKDWYADFISGATAAFNCVVGSVANNIITLAAPAIQLINPPQDGDRNGYRTDELEFQCIRSAAGGDDEFTAAFS